MPHDGKKPPLSPSSPSSNKTLPVFFKCKSVTELVKNDVKRKVSGKIFSTTTLHASNDSAALQVLYDNLMKKQKELQAELSTLQKALDKSKKENERLENERNRALFLYKKQQEELNEMHVQRESDSELIRSLKNDLDKLYLSFKTYRESKESELQNLLKQNTKLFCMWVVYLKLLSSNNST